MQRAPNIPVTKYNIKMPDCVPNVETIQCEDENEQQQRRQQLINFGHSQWGFKNWNWSVTKQEMDFVDFANGKYCVGVVTYVSITVKSLELHRENIGYATSVAYTKGLAIYMSRQCAVTNALRETLLSFGGNMATELMELLSETARADSNKSTPPASESPLEPTPTSRPAEPPKNPPLPVARKDVNAPPVARAHPMPVNLPSLPTVPANIVPQPVVAPLPPPAPSVVPPQIAPPPVAARGPRNQNVSFVLQPVMGGMVGGLYPRLAAPAPAVYPEYYECAGSWHYACDGAGRPLGGPRDEQAPLGPHSLGHAHAHPHGPHHQHGPPSTRGCWIKPTYFYDGFWTEQKVKRWVAEQLEKRLPADLLPTLDATTPANF